MYNNVEIADLNVKLEKLKALTEVPDDFRIECTPLADNKDYYSVTVIKQGHSPITFTKKKPETYLINLDQYHVREEQYLLVLFLANQVTADKNECEQILESLFNQIKNDDNAEVKNKFLANVIWLLGDMYVNNEKIPHNYSDAFDVLYRTKIPLENLKLIFFCADQLEIIGKDLFTSLLWSKHNFEDLKTNIISYYEEDHKNKKIQGENTAQTEKNVDKKSEIYDPNNNNSEVSSLLETYKKKSQELRKLFHKDLESLKTYTDEGKNRIYQQIIRHQWLLVVQFAEHCWSQKETKDSTLFEDFLIQIMAFFLSLLKKDAILVIDFIALISTSPNFMELFSINAKNIVALLSEPPSRNDQDENNLFDEQLTMVCECIKHLTINVEDNFSKFSKDGAFDFQSFLRAWRFDRIQKAQKKAQETPQSLRSEEESHKASPKEQNRTAPANAHVEEEIVDVVKRDLSENAQKVDGGRKKIQKLTANAGTFSQQSQSAAPQIFLAPPSQRAEPSKKPDNKPR